MCGIYGVYFADRGRRVADTTLRAMGDAIRHRGPDESGLLTDGAFGFGMQRLSIIDLKTGQQPIANEDGTVQVVFNGEIYNYRELARDSSSGFTSCDHAGHASVVPLWDLRPRVLPPPQVKGSRWRGLEDPRAGALHRARRSRDQAAILPRRRRLRLRLRGMAMLCVP